MKFHTTEETLPTTQHCLYIQCFNYLMLHVQKENISNNNKDLKRKTLSIHTIFQDKNYFFQIKVNISHFHFFIPSCILTSIYKIRSWHEQWSTDMLIYKWNTLNYCFKFVLIFSRCIADFLWKVRRNFASPPFFPIKSSQITLVSKNISKQTIKKIVLTFPLTLLGI